MSEPNNVAPVDCDRISLQYETRRAFRNGIARAGALTPRMSTPSNFAKIAPGHYGTTSDQDLVNVSTSGQITFSRDAYVDDVIAFCLGAIRGNPTISDSIKQHLASFVNEMDARAVTRHGYSSSEAERVFTWTAV
jgi:hypothetical protein